MTIQMHDDAFDRELGAFLAWQAEDVAGAPSADEAAALVGSRVRPRAPWTRPLPRLALVVAGLLILTMVTAALVGAFLDRVNEPALPIAYEAVFLRREGAEGPLPLDGMADVVVVAVDVAGNEREVTRFPIPGGGVRVPMTGAVSSSGLLLTPRVGDDHLTHYEIRDLRNPGVDPIVIDGITQDVDQIGRGLSPFWGPDEHLAIPWYERTNDSNRGHLAFIDGRTGAGPSVDVPGDPGLLPQWTVDGSGVFLGGDYGPWAILRPDGSVSPTDPGVVQGVPDPEHRPDGVATGANFGVDGVFAGWMEVEPPTSSYEAVFLGLETVDGADAVAVSSVNADGVVRRIASLPGAWTTPGIADRTGSGPPWSLAPMGTVSPSGLLAIPTGGQDLMMHWEIYDLHHPEAAPIVVPGMEQFIESLRDTPYFWVNPRGGAFWGPGEQLAVLWYVSPGEVHLQLGIVEGRTGTVTSVNIPDGLTVLPAWAADGSGVFVSSSDPTLDGRDLAPSGVLGLDGAVRDLAGVITEPSCRPARALEFACMAPDWSMIVDNHSNGFSPTPLFSLLAPDGTKRLDIPGKFAGWLAVDP